jgi:hypothetical protein
MLPCLGMTATARYYRGLHLAIDLFAIALVAIVIMFGATQARMRAANASCKQLYDH